MAQGHLQVMAVDILPSELPLEASQHFSNSILPYLKAIIREYESDDSSGKMGVKSRPDPEHRQALNRATTAFNGQLTEKHSWLYEQLREAEEKAASINNLPSPQTRKRVLLLGSGLVSRPFVDQICMRSDIECIVGKLYHN